MRQVSPGLEPFSWDAQTVGACQPLVAPVMDIPQLVDTHGGGGLSVLWGMVLLCGSGSLGRPIHSGYWTPYPPARAQPTCVFQRWEVPSMTSPTTGPQPSSPPHVNQVSEFSLVAPWTRMLEALLPCDGHSVVERGLALCAVCPALGSGSQVRIAPSSHAVANLCWGSAQATGRLHGSQCETGFLGPVLLWQKNMFFFKLKWVRTQILPEILSSLLWDKEPSVVAWEGASSGVWPPQLTEAGVELQRCRPVNGQTLGTRATPPTILACSQSPRSTLPLSFLSFADYKNMYFFFFFLQKKSRLSL